MPTSLSDYCNSYKTLAFERVDGVLEMRLHRDGGEATWSAAPGGMNDELPEAFLQVAQDPENRVVIFTGTGDSWLAEINPNEPFPDISDYVMSSKARFARRKGESSRGRYWNGWLNSSMAGMLSAPEGPQRRECRGERTCSPRPRS